MPCQLLFGAQHSSAPWVPNHLAQNLGPKCDPETRSKEPGKLPKSYVMCTQGQKQIGQAGPVWSSVVLLSAVYVVEAMQ